LAKRRKTLLRQGYGGRSKKRISLILDVWKKTKLKILKSGFICLIFLALKKRLVLVCKTKIN